MYTHTHIENKTKKTRSCTVLGREEKTNETRARDRYTPGTIMYVHARPLLFVRRARRIPLVRATSKN